MVIFTFMQQAHECISIGNIFSCLGNLDGFELTVIILGFCLCLVLCLIHFSEILPMHPVFLFSGAVFLLCWSIQRKAVERHWCRGACNVAKHFYVY